MNNMTPRHLHQHEVLTFIRTHISPGDWKFSLPRGWGKESYFAYGNGQDYFVKVGVEVGRYVALAEIGLTPPVLLEGKLDGGLSVIVQPVIAGRKPSRVDYHERLPEVAELLHKMQDSSHIKRVLPAGPSNSYKDAGMQALDRLRQKWERHRAQVPSAAGFVDESLERLEKQISQFSGEGLVVSHGDICNVNWLFASDGKIYLMDFDLMKMDDPALDLGALLWWYYPPELRQQFLNAAGCRYDDEFRHRMQVRMAMHCLDITLPREESFDQFTSEDFGESLGDFKAVLEGKENPQGYD